ncbi:YggS family pyridoxal phosphate-dependent enzyme [Branchiibius sp. NY16-3462-2]|uniref:YggS family pyridoxal phosphate-dependent enzyme n=1 Tax=Branchiibius sp. NY16-3462-2 TaxID=1807500 RepID=UPI00079928B8|nr:YggS family pyridoxal phosphate-dependent enzyme [Branchiibius sp. NY16-3462-2]KYH43966.1 YggS family pyridoxal phosphate enzyme [Branchiibius sp. NY16-3462-2]
MSDARTQQLADRLAAVRERIGAACAAAQRPVDDVRLVVVTKYFPAADVQRLAGLGVVDIGESRDQEAAAKLADLPGSVREHLRVHFIGQIQSNKARHIAAYADLVQSVDRTKVLAPLARGALERGRVLPVFLQVDLAGDDEGRGGVLPAQLPALADAAATTEGLDLVGLMAVAPLHADPAAAFERLATLSQQVHEDHPGATLISAGMSGDLEQAVAAGATHLRVGSAILGDRPARR